MRDSKYFLPGDIIIYMGLLLIFLLGSFAAMGRTNSGSPTAVVTQDGKSIHRVRLDAVTEPYEFRVEGSGGAYNIIQVEHGRIRVVEASCPDQIDVKQGWISQSHQSIVCLPNRLVIRILKAEHEPVGEIDGIAF